MTLGKVIFRVDASFEMGSGHVMRCLTLANALKEKNTECLFICRDHPGNMVDVIEKHGFVTYTLTTTLGTGPDQEIPNHAQQSNLAHADWLGCHWMTDVNQTKKILEKHRPDWLVVDHYALDARWEAEIYIPSLSKMVIDDLADRPHECDLLVDQNLGREKIDYIELAPAECQILVGPEYSLLRTEFAQLRDISLRRRIGMRPKNILITLGGIDPLNASGRILDILSHCNLSPETRITVVLGSNAPWIAQVRELASGMPYAVQVEVDVTNMAELMVQSDWAIGAGGGTSWERCAMGLPTMMVVLADNQRALTKALDAHGAALNLGEIDGLEQRLPAALETFSDSRMLQTMSALAADITDGLGCERVVRTLENRI